MSRRSLSLALLAILAVQLLGGIALASVCDESCADDAEGSCPPACALCTSCTHAKSAIVRHAGSGTSRVVTEHDLPEPSIVTASLLAADIFHVPLLG